MKKICKGPSVICYIYNEDNRRHTHQIPEM